MPDKTVRHPAEEKKVRGVREEIQLSIFYYSLFLLFILILKILESYKSSLTPLTFLHSLPQKDGGKFERHNRLFQISRHVFLSFVYEIISQP